MASPDQRNLRDPRNQPDRAHDEDRHGRKKNTGTNQPTRREAGSSRHVDRERQPRRPSDSDKR